MKKRLFAILLALTLTLGLAACGGKSSSESSFVAAGKSSTAQTAPMEMRDEAVTNGYWDGAEAGAETPQMAPNPTANAKDSSERSTLPDGVKMIYRANMELQSTEFEKATADVRTLTQSLGGYFEEQSIHNYSSGYRTANYTVRVPAERFEDFLHQIGDLCHVTYQTQSAEDVSEYYYDMESRLETAKIKLDRLQDLLSRADMMEDIITLENAISDTEYQIERLSGEKRHYDSLIGYSTIYITLSEVYRVTEPETAPLTFGQRIASAFREGLRDFGDALEDFAEWLAYSWLTLLVIAAVVVVIVRLVRRSKAKRALGGETRERRGLLRRKRKDTPADTQEEPKD
jgi:hypothetical protein